MTLLKMRSAHICLAAVLALISEYGSAWAQSICGGEVAFQCMTDAIESPEQITVCAQDHSYALTRHSLASGEMYYDAALIADANTTWFSWDEGDQARLEIGFWSVDLAELVTLHVALPWNDAPETVSDYGLPEMWLQTPPWQVQVEQTLCVPKTIYAEPEALWPAQRDRGPIGRFFSQDLIMPRAETVGRARVSALSTEAEGVPVYASARPNAATPIWWILHPGETVEILDRSGDYHAVAIPTNGISGCMIRPAQIGHPYTGPCATGWVETRHLKRVQ